MTELQTKYPGKVLSVYDNLFTFDERHRFLMFMRNSMFRTGGSDRADSPYSNQIYSLYSVDDIKNMGLTETNGFQKIETLHGLRENPVGNIRVNLSNPNESNTLHTDEQGLTFLYYANMDWNIDWGGHTLFMDDILEEPKYVCLYKPGRVVVFDGTIPHMIMTPSPVCPVQRFTFVIQYKGTK